ncbi:MAG: hypothetical protein JRH20_32755, partial [Deltaproteobacteria bacterium]|nr:hypothetical protein [Deltaproteobacteria bacterium]
GGIPGAKAAEDLHFSTEHLDLETKSYENAYPPGAPATFTPAVGPTQAPPHPRWGFPGFTMNDAESVTRMPFFGSAYGVASHGYFQWTYVADRERVYAFIYNRTLTYDPQTKTWTDLEVTPTPTDNSASLETGTRAMMWGAMGYDPIHKELVLIGGSAPLEGGSPGTWAFSLDDNTWRRLTFGSTPLNALRQQVQDAKTEAHEMVALLRNRLFKTESTEEAQRALAQPATALAQRVNQLSDGFDPQLLPLEEKEQGTRAAGHLARAKTAAGVVSAGVAPDAAGIASVQGLIDALLTAELALNVEPPARALSQLAYHRGTASLVLFGGDGQDRGYADTWSYDCATRRWTQHYPALSPSPRAGHALLTLPKSDKIVLVGGYRLANGHSYMYRDAYETLSAEVWSYDPAVKSWTKLDIGPSELPKSGGLAPALTAAVNEDDMLIWLPAGSRRSTWALAVDPSKVDTAGTTEEGWPPETLLFRGDEDMPSPGYRSYDPAFYDRQPVPAQHALDQLASTITPNRWTAIKPPQGVEVAGWGTSTFDADRRQVLYWGGGHSEYKGTNVMHFSLATQSWSLSARPDWVLEWSAGFHGAGTRLPGLRLRSTLSPNARGEPWCLALRHRAA